MGIKKLYKAQRIIINLFIKLIMRRLIYIALAVAIVASCKKKEEKDAQVETRSATEITDTKATLWGKITETGTAGIKEQGIEIVGGNRIPHTTTRADSFGVQLTNLVEGQTYRYRAYVVENNNRERYGAERSFTTLKPANFGVSHQANLRTANSLTISFSGVENLKEWGVHYATSTPTESSPQVKSSTESTLTITNLQPNTTYRFLPVATDKNDLRVTQSVFEAATLCAAPTLEIVSVTGVSPTEQKVVFKINDTGGGVITVFRLSYAEAGSATWTNINITYAEGNIERVITGLKPATGYRVFAHAANRDANAQSDTILFTTLGSTPKLAIPVITAETSYRVNMTGGKVDDKGLLPITEYGFSWSTTSNGTATYKRITAGSTDAFNYLCYDLLASTTYYIRAYARNQIGTGYSEPVQITTPNITWGADVADRYIVGKTYNTVVIGSQTWMAENLEWNGATTFNVTTIINTGGAMCPVGWHIPTRAEWDELIAETGGSGDAYYIGNNMAPKVLRIKEDGYELGLNSAGLSISATVVASSSNFAAYWTSTQTISGGTFGRNYVFFYHEVNSITSPNGYVTTSGEIYYNDWLYPVRCIKD